MNTLQVIYYLATSPEITKVVICEEGGYKTPMEAIALLSLELSDREFFIQSSKILGLFFIYQGAE